jgi:hypothetical protein
MIKNQIWTKHLSRNDQREIRGEIFKNKLNENKQFSDQPQFFKPKEFLHLQ